MEGEGAGGLKGFREEPRTLSPAPLFPSTLSLAPVGPSNFPLLGVKKPHLFPRGRCTWPWGLRRVISRTSFDYTEQSPLCPPSFQCCSWQTLLKYLPVLQRLQALS